MLSTLTNLFIDGSRGSQQNFLHLLLTNTVACFLIGLSSMASLFFFNLLIHRRNPFAVVVRPILTSNGHQKGHLQNGHLKNGHFQNGYYPVNSSSPPPPSSDPSKSELLRSVLSFAVGGLLGDVFLHLLPEASGQLVKTTSNGGLQMTVVDAQQYLGVRILAGIILFVIMESVFVQLSETGDKDEDKLEEEEEKEQETTLDLPTNGNLRYRGPQEKPKDQNKISLSSSSPPIDVTGYLNLLANGLDNFTHGMSVAASFLVSFKTGALTTLAIIIHEIPHEIADNAILLRSGFSCWAAFRAQLTISLVTFLGALTVLIVDGRGSGPLDSLATQSRTLWILPLTAGGFIYIALTNLLPELLTFEQGRKKSTNAFRLLQRILLVLAGIGTMAAVNVVDIF